MAASTPAKKTTKPVRKNAKKYDLVSFSLDSFEGEFQLPVMTQLPVSLMRKSQSEEGLFLLQGWMSENAPECAEALDDLDAEEFGELVEAWSEASGADSGKSLESSDS